MPNHCVNRPGKALSRARRGKHLSSKRAYRTSRLSRLEASNKNSLTPNTKLIAANGVITNRVLSKKRAKKIARNMKYAKARKEQSKKIVDDLNKKNDDSMDIDSEHKSNRRELRHPDKEDPIRKALWLLIEKNGSMFPDSASTEGTTLGGPSF
ncbi:hypothetical protein HII13_002874 [Brettanomyces bruxellensis]|uniref:DEBR0S1_03048g1_1 n=1 Tax=Dekkera bruxellensis TaxID=5007 RepID=A0A3F2XYP6_DEKBR|nr:hypothetical protein HII13_002874 [Brettanomyces bruxellensis]KAF6013166.1 hypothetical protein HII12_001881 [Brettanomyces bruxellensis]VUG15918.1 ALB1 [Brettanomyces bruxellensis]